jgi:hypothetical protein
VGTLGYARFVRESANREISSREDEKSQGEFGTRGEDERLVDFMARLRSRGRKYRHGGRGRVFESEQTVESVSGEIFGAELSGRFESASELANAGRGGVHGGGREAGVGFTVRGGVYEI